jgi:hypothetical protein
MNGQALQTGATRDTADALLALVRADGTASHAHPTSEVLTKGPEAARNVADIVHLLCLLHGRHPGVIDHAVAREADATTKEFLTVAAEAFAEERALLAKLVVSVGPQPSTPGQADTESAVLAQHHAVEMLAQSERTGCSFGAAMAVVADWSAVRPVLEMVAKRLSIDIAHSKLPAQRPNAPCCSARSRSWRSIAACGICSKRAPSPATITKHLPKGDRLA